MIDETDKLMPKLRSSRFRRSVRFLKMVVVFGSALFLALYFLFSSEWIYNTLLFPRLARSLGGTISVGSMNVSPLRLIQLKDVRFQDSLGNTNAIDELSLRYRFLSLIWGEAVLEELYVKNANVNLDYFLIKDSSVTLTPPIVDDPALLKEKTAELYPRLAFLLSLKKIHFENLNLIVSGARFSESFPKTIALNKLDFKIDDFQSDVGGDLAFGFNFVTEGEKSILPTYAEGRLKTKIDLHPDREKVALRLNLELGKLKGKIGEIVLDDTSVSLGASVAYSLNEITLSEVSLKASNLDSALVDASGAGKIDIKESSGYSSLDFDVKIEALHNELLNYIPDYTTAITDGVLKGRIAGSVRSLEDLTLNSTLNLQNLQIMGSEMNKEIPASFVLSFSGAGKNANYKVDSSALEIRSKDELLAEVQFMGNIDASEHKTLMKGSLTSSALQIDKLEALWPKNESVAKTILEKELLVNEKDKIFQADLQVKLAHSSYGETIAKNASATIKYGERLLRGESIEMLVNDAPLKASFIITLDDPMYKPTIDLDIRKLDIQPVVRSFSKERAKNLSGQLQRLTFKVKNSRLQKDLLETARDGDFRAIFKGLKIPAYLQDTPPINLIFLPIDALKYTGKMFGGEVLPPTVIEATDLLKDDKRAGQIEFDHAQIQGLINSKGITFSDTKFNSSVLPTFSFYGGIDFDKNLDLVIGVELLKVSVPLPVHGSLDFPLPDLLGFPLAVVRSLGLSAINFGEMFDSEEKLEKEFFGDPDEPQEKPVLNDDEVP